MGPTMTGLERARNAASQGRLAVVAGAGISMLPPSSLPSWGNLTSTLLAGAVDCAAAAPCLDAAAVAAVRSLTPASITPATLSEAIVKYVAGAIYFPVLTALDGTTTNANHQALADLARLGRLRAIVTPNFDTLIERAFREREVPLAEPAPDRDPADGCSLTHVHGAATSVASMIDTIGQKTQGLRFASYARLQHELRDRHVLVVGFSGEDLQFASDYLALESTPIDGVTWVIQAGKAPGGQVMALRERFVDRMQIVEGELPGLWRELGATVTRDAVAVDPRAAQNAKDQLAGRTRQLFDTLGTLRTVALCMRLLNDSGQRDGARHVYDCLAALARTWSEPRLPEQVTVLRALSSTPGLATNVAWLERDVACCQRWLADRRANAAAQPITRQDEDLMHFNLAIGFGNLAMTYAGASKLGSADDAAWAAFDHALLAADLRAFAGAWYARGLISKNADEAPSLILWYLLLAEGAAVAGGNVSLAFFAALERGRLLMSGGEYDNAADSFERAAQRAVLAKRREMTVDVLAAQAALAGRRGDAMTTTLFDEALGLADGIPDASARVRWLRLESFCNYSYLHDTLVGDCDALTGLLRAGVAPNPASGIPDESMVEQMKAYLGTIRDGTPPPFVATADVLDALPEGQQMRQMVINGEYRRDPVSVALWLKQMTVLKLRAGDDDPRAEELALAYLRVAEKLDLATTFDARLLVSQAAYRLGDLKTARHAMRELEHIDLAFDPEFEQRKQDWLQVLDGAPRQSQHHPYLLIRSLADGWPSLRASDRERGQVVEGLTGTIPAVAQVMLCELAQEYRETGDWTGLAGCYELLARSAAKMSRQALAAELRRIASDLRRA